MKTLLIGLLSLISTTAFAESSLTVDIHAKAKIHIHHWGIKSGGRCGSGSNGTYTNATNSFEEKKSFTQEGNGEQTNHAGVSTHYAAPSRGGSFEMYKFFTELKISTEGESTIFDAKVWEEQRLKVDGFWKQSCDHNHMNENLKNKDFETKIVFKYKVPENVWAVRIEESELNSAFNATSRQALIGHLYQTNDKRSTIVGSNIRIVWVEPGSIITQEFIMTGKDNTFENKPTYQIKITPLGEILKANVLANSELLSNFQKDIQKIVKYNKSDLTAENNKTYTAAVNNYVNRGFTILRSMSNLTPQIQAMTTAQLNKISKELYELARSTFPNNLSSETKQNIKSIAALVSYEVSSLFIEDLQPYCDQREVYLEALQRKVNVTGFRYAIFLMQRMRTNIDNKGIDLHKTFLRRLQQLQSDNHTYSSVFNVEGLAEDLRFDFGIVRKLAEPQRRPFAASLQDLKDLYKVFRTVGTGANSTENVIGSFIELANLEYSYVKQLFKHVRSYSPDNQAKINVDSLVEMLMELEKKRDAVIYHMQNNIRLLSFDTSAGNDTLGEMMVRLRVHNINIVSSTYENLGWDFPFENIRAAYVEAERNEKNINTVRNCLMN